MLAIFDKMRIESDDVREWFAAQLRVRTQYEQDDARLKAEEIQKAVIPSASAADPAAESPTSGRD